jgi:hypothetical protein
VGLARITVFKIEMDDELVLLQALYSDIRILDDEEDNNKMMTLLFEYIAPKVGKVRLRVKVSRADYPLKAKPISTIERGLSLEMEKFVIMKIDLACKEYERELCLVQVFTTFIQTLNELTATCGICLDEVKDEQADDIIITEPCSHIFHRSTCFADWAAQCTVNHKTSAEAELNRTRRRQRENTAESEVRLLQARVDALENERSRVQNRREVLNNKIKELSTIPNPQPSTKRPEKNAVPERDKADEDLLDLNEAQKRIAEVGRLLKTNNSEIAAARKLRTQSQGALDAIRQALQQESMEELRQSSTKIPCPMCRTELNIS